MELEYRLDDTANKYLNVFFDNNSYDWLDGYTQKYGGGFIWRRTLQRFTDIFRFKDPKPVMPQRPAGAAGFATSGHAVSGSSADTTRVAPVDTVKVKK